MNTFKIQADTLLKTLSKVLNIISKSHTEVLLCARIILENNILSVEGTNQDMYQICYIENVEGNDMKFLVNAKSLFDILQKLSNQVCEISVASKLDAEFLTVKQGKSSFEVQTMNIEHFPELLKIHSEIESEIDAEDLKFLVSKTKTSIYKDAARYNINGMLLEGSKEAGNLRAVSTNGHRLAFAEIKNIVISNDFKITIPIKSVEHIAKIMATQDGKISIKTNKKTVSFVYKNHTFTTKLIDAEFPDYNRIVPKNYTKHFTVNAKTLLASLQKVQMPDTTDLKLQIENDTINLLTKVGTKKAVDEITCATEEQDAFIFSGNIADIVDVVSNITEGEVIIFYDDWNKPLLIKDNKSENYFYITMPLKVQP